MLCARFEDNLGKHGEGKRLGVVMRTSRGDFGLAVDFSAQ